MAAFRKIDKINIRGTEPGSIAGARPRMQLVDPSDLYVEAEYQRDISGKSIHLIRTIVNRFNWAHFKPPIVSQCGDKLYVIDGQHTAIAAASHPDIEKIPVMVCDSETMEGRARAFINHNKIRLNLTAVQIYYAELTVKDEIATLVETACRRAGVKILKQPPGHGLFNVGETMAVVSLKNIVTRKGPAGLARILKILVSAERQIKATELAAVNMIIYSKKFPPIDDEVLIKVIASKMVGEWEADVAIRRERDKISLSVALAEAWMTAAHKRRAA